MRAQLQHRAGIGYGLDHPADVINAQPILGNELAQDALVGVLKALKRPLEVGKIFSRHAHRFGLVGDGDVDDAVRHLYAHRADLLGTEDAQTATLDHRRAAHADVRVTGGDHDVTAAEQ